MDWKRRRPAKTAREIVDMPPEELVKEWGDNAEHAYGTAAYAMGTAPIEACELCGVAGWHSGFTMCSPCASLVQLLTYGWDIADGDPMPDGATVFMHEIIVARTEHAMKLIAQKLRVEIMGDLEGKE